MGRQAGVHRVALLFSTTRNPASISFNYLHAESQSGKFNDVLNRINPNTSSSFFCVFLLSCSFALNLRRLMR